VTSRDERSASFAGSAGAAGDPDAAWVGRARGGDAAAFRVLVERHQDRVFALAWRLTGPRPEAEEVAQDALLRAWRSLPSFRGEASFATWLHRIVIRVALDRRADLVRRRERERALDEAPDAAAAVDPADAADDRMTARVRVALLAALSEAQRTAVTLHYLEDRPVLEVAQEMGLPENTVKTHLSRARAAMRAAFARGEARSRGAPVA
jgi:RNA polymerase sigma-70 factor (ECF subfamily)